MMFCNAVNAQLTTAPLPGSQNTDTFPNYVRPQSQFQSQIQTQIQQDTQSSLESVPLAGLNSSSSGKTEAINKVDGEDCPISISGLHAIIDKYKAEIVQTSFNPESLDPLLNWLDSLIKAHNRLAMVFSKQVASRASYQCENTLVHKLRGIRNEVLYLKAQSLTDKKNVNQAMPLLVDIVCSEPNSQLGIKAYSLLRKSGFSGE